MSYRSILRRTAVIGRCSALTNLESRIAVVTSNEPDRDLVVGAVADEFQLEALELHGYRDFCLQRLTHLVALRAELPHHCPLDPTLQQMLVARALYSAYRDCVASGAKARAARIVAGSAEA